MFTLGELRRQLSQKGEINREIVEAAAKNDTIDDRDTIIEHLESRLNITEDDHEAFIEKCNMCSIFFLSGAPR